jgi:hypothetical protein
MAIADHANPLDPLDPLRRFVPTPLRTQFRVGTTRVTVQANDFSLLPAFPLDVSLRGFDAPNFEWKLVRDCDTPGFLEEPMILACGTLTVVAMGAACLLGMDHERRELLCFLGKDIDIPTFQEVLVPFFCRLTNDVTSTGTFGNLQSGQEGAMVHERN